MEINHPDLRNCLQYALCILPTSNSTLLDEPLCKRHPFFLSETLLFWMARRCLAYFYNSTHGPLVSRRPRSSSVPFHQSGKRRLLLSFGLRTHALCDSQRAASDAVQVCSSVLFVRKRRRRQEGERWCSVHNAFRHNGRLDFARASFPALQVVCYNVVDFQVLIPLPSRARRTNFGLPYCVSTTVLSVPSIRALET